MRTIIVYFTRYYSDFILYVQLIAKRKTITAPFFYFELVEDKRPPVCHAGLAPDWHDSRFRQDENAMSPQARPTRSQKIKRSGDSPREVFIRVLATVTDRVVHSSSAFFLFLGSLSIHLRLVRARMSTLSSRSNVNCRHTRIYINDLNDNRAQE